MWLNVLNESLSAFVLANESFRLLNVLNGSFGCLPPERPVQCFRRPANASFGPLNSLANASSSAFNPLNGPFSAFAAPANASFGAPNSPNDPFGYLNSPNDPFRSSERPEPPVQCARRPP